jgi:hypothetical protein
MDPNILGTMLGMLVIVRRQNMAKSFKEKCKQWLKRYDAWCQELGLTPSQRRSCVPYRAEDKKDHQSH